MQYVVRGTRTSDGWNVPIDKLDTMEAATSVSAAVDANEYLDVYVLTVPTWTDGKPDMQLCRVCQRESECDVTGRSAADLYPSPLVCSAECLGEYMEYLLGDLLDGEEEPAP